MKEVIRKRFIADCGRGFWVKSKCATHENNCTCWSNPRNKTCKTCAYGRRVNEALDEGGRDTYWECSHEEFNAHTNTLGIDYISVKCPLWQAKA